MMKATLSAATLSWNTGNKKTPPRNARDDLLGAKPAGGTNAKFSLRRMETEGPSSSPAPEPLRDGDASASKTTREDLERRLRLSESVALELERALEGKSRSLDESTRAADALRRELRAATAANEADGSVPAAAMDAARAEIERLRAALVDGERERAALKSLASKATTKGAEGRDGGDEHDAMNGDARLRAAVAEERLAMAERALAEWREYASALEERCAAAEAAAADAIRDARSASLRAGTETRAEALASAARARATRDENPEGVAREEDGGDPVPPPVPAQTCPPRVSPPPPPPPPYAAESSRVAFQRARVANGELAAALAAARSVARAAEEASARAASALARASSRRSRVDDAMVGARGELKAARVEADVAAADADVAAADADVAAGRTTASGEAFEASDGDRDRGVAMRVDRAKVAADAGDEGKEEGDEGNAGDEGKEAGDEGNAAGEEGGDGVDWVAKASESRHAWAERRARGDIDPTLEKIASEY